MAKRSRVRLPPCLQKLLKMSGASSNSWFGDFLHLRLSVMLFCCLATCILTGNMSWVRHHSQNRNARNNRCWDCIPFVCLCSTWWLCFLWHCPSKEVGTALNALKIVRWSSLLMFHSLQRWWRTVQSVPFAISTPSFCLTYVSGCLYFWVKWFEGPS